MSTTRSVRAPRARDQLTRELVVDTALGVADAEGLDAVSVRRVAQELGVTPMALYWHVANKDELLAGMGDRLYSDLALDLDPASPWDVQLRALVDELLRALRAHPGAVSLAAARILHNERGQELTEKALGLLQSGGFSVAEAATIARHLMLTAVALVMEGLEVECLGLPPEAKDQLLRGKKEALKALPPKRFPHLVEAADALGGWEGETARFAYGLDLVMAGIGQLAPPPPKARRR